MERTPHWSLWASSDTVSFTFTYHTSSSSPSSLSPLASSLTRSVFHSELKNWLLGKSFPPYTVSFPTGLILQTFGPFIVFILLNGCICLHGVLDYAACKSVLMHCTFTHSFITFRPPVTSESPRQTIFFCTTSTSQVFTRMLRNFASCDVCQRLGKDASNATAPLNSLTLVSERFCQVAIGIVWALPIYKDTGNRFNTTVLDLCAHYPEAIPLKQHTAQDVIKALANVLSHFSFPQEILSNQGSDFMSALMQIFLNEFGINQIGTSAYHPQTNGACERFNGTLKSMLCSMTVSSPICGTLPCRVFFSPTAKCQWRHLDAVL